MRTEAAGVLSARNRARGLGPMCSGAWGLPYFASFAIASVIADDRCQASNGSACICSKSDIMASRPSRVCILKRWLSQKPWFRRLRAANAVAKPPRVPPSNEILSRSARKGRPSVCASRWSRKLDGQESAALRWSRAELPALFKRLDANSQRPRFSFEELSHIGSLAKLDAELVACRHTAPYPTGGIQVQLVVDIWFTAPDPIMVA